MSISLNKTQIVDQSIIIWYCDQLYNSEKYYYVYYYSDYVTKIIIEHVVRNIYDMHDGKC